MVIDINEDFIQHIGKNLLDLLLIDRSTKKHIVWATSDYMEQYGDLYSPECEITPDLITGAFAATIRPRVTKAKVEQNNRTRDKAEVFTPSWVCNKQNNLVDEQWFGRPDVFNATYDKKWKSHKGKIVFPGKAKKTWQDYVRAKRMEITCGEAPYLVSRYDTVTGKIITDVNNRIGLLDRKLRIVNENTDNEQDWMIWVKKAYQSIYAYEYQGDNLLLARENLLYTFIDNMLYKFNREPIPNELWQIAYIISWNIWQMDGLTYTAPYSEIEHEEEYQQLALFDFEDEKEPVLKDSVPCIIRDWTNKCYVEFKSLIKQR
ncbi:MAG: restriction endonuclease subunit M [Oscillospiraceae bacterium]